MLDAEVKAVLNGEGEVGHLAEGSLHLVAPQAREDHHMVLRLRAEGLQQRERRVGHGESALLSREGVERGSRVE